MASTTFGGNGQYKLQDNEDGTFEILDTVTGASTEFKDGVISHDEYVRANQTQRTPIVALDNNDTYELVVKVADGKSLKLFEAAALVVDETTTAGATSNTGLYAELVDAGGTVVYSSTGENVSASGSTLHTLSNTSGAAQYVKLRIENTSGAAINSPGAIGVFSAVIE